MRLKLMVLIALLGAGCGEATNQCVVNLGTTSDGAERDIHDTNNLDFAQSFQLDSAATVSSLGIYVKKGGSESFESGDQLTIAIHASDGSGNPDTTALSVTTTLDYLDLNNLSDSARYLTVTLSSEVNLSAGTTYWVVVDGSYGATEDHFVTWVGNSTNTYEDGSANQRNTTPSWLGEVADDGSKTPAALKDFLFRLGCQ